MICLLKSVIHSMTKLNQEIGLECGQRRRALHGGVRDAGDTDHGDVYDVGASAPTRKAARRLDPPAGVCQWYGCHCDSHLCPATPEVAPATLKFQPGSTGSSWEQLEEVPGWSASTAADPSFQPL